MLLEKVPPVPSTTLKGLEGGISMKKYLLTAIVDGRTVISNREFQSRAKAIDYIFNYYSRNNNENLRVEDEYSFDGNKHNIEYVCDYDNRFKIVRTIA